MRGGAGRAPEGTTGMKQNGGHRALVDQHLPLNRKERYFTGTVLPAIVCADNFRHFDLFLRLLTTAELPRVDPHPERTNLQFFTEYSFVEALTGAGPGSPTELCRDSRRGWEIPGTFRLRESPKSCSQRRTS